VEALPASHPSLTRLVTTDSHVLTEEKMEKMEKITRVMDVPLKALLAASVVSGVLMLLAMDHAPVWLIVAPALFYLVIGTTVGYAAVEVIADIGEFTAWQKAEVALGAVAAFIIFVGGCGYALGQMGFIWYLFT